MENGVDVTEDDDYSAIRSIELQEILGNIPGWIIRYGVIILLLTTGTLVAFSFFIYLPIEIETVLVIKSSPPAVNIYSSTDGTIKEILVNEGDKIRKGSILAIVENEKLETSKVETPIDCQVHLIDPLKYNMKITQDQPLFSAIPKKRTIFGIMPISKSFINLVKEGCIVRVKFEGNNRLNFPLMAIVRKRQLKDNSSELDNLILDFDKASINLIQKRHDYFDQTKSVNVEIVFLKENLFKRIFRL